MIARAIPRARLGIGLFAIHDDEDAAEVMGVPTYRYKLVALGVSCALAGVAGGIQALFVSYVTANSTFNITVPLTVILMCVLGGTRHWAGPALGAVLITVLLYASTAADQAVAGKAVTGAILVAAVLFMPNGVIELLRTLFARRRSPATVAQAPHRAGADVQAGFDAAVATTRARMRVQRLRDRRSRRSARRAASTPAGACLLAVRALRKSFSGVRALDGVDLDVRDGEILGILGPNGSGKSTLINVISGHYRADTGSVTFAGRELARLPAHRIARAGIARTYQVPRPFAHLTLRDNVALTAMFGGAALARPQADRGGRNSGSRSPACTNAPMRCPATSTCTRPSSSSSRARSRRVRAC